MGRDTIGYASGLNLYECETSNPINNVDPFGNIPGAGNVQHASPYACCTSKQKYDDQVGYGKCIQAVDADIGQQEKQLLVNYNNDVAIVDGLASLCNLACV
jgi:hypothetical protein